MAVLPKIVCLVLLLHNVPRTIGLAEGPRGVNWNLGGDVLNGLEHPGKLIGELGGDIKNGIEGFAKKAENIGEDLFNDAEKIGSEIIGDIGKGAGNIVNGIEHGAEAVGSGVIGNIAKGAGELVEDVGKGAVGLIEDLGEGIEKGAEGIVDGAKGAIDGIGGIVGKLTPGKKKNHHGGDSREQHHNKHHKEDSRGKHHKKHRKDDSRERDDSHERRGDKHHFHRHTGRGIDRRTGIGSRDGIKTPILNLLGMTQAVCRVSYAAENVIADLGHFHIWVDQQMGMIERNAVNYLVDNVVLKLVDGVRKYQNRVVGFIIDTHIGVLTFATNTIIEGYRVSKAPIRELFAC